MTLGLAKSRSKIVLFDQLLILINKTCIVKVGIQSILSCNKNNNDTTCVSYINEALDVCKKCYRTFEYFAFFIHHNFYNTVKLILSIQMYDLLRYICWIYTIKYILI